MPNLDFSDKQIEALLKGVYEGEITEYDLPEDLYLKIANLLKKGVYKGFGGSLNDFKENSKDYELLAELRENIYIFSAAKTFSQVEDMVSLLMDGDKVVPWQDFKEAALDVYKTYNVDWLKAEYNTSIGQAQSAVKWNQIESQKEVLPLLRYSTIGDACDICAPLDGLTAPVDDPVWDTIMPLNHFNCFCIVEQQEDGEVTKNRDEIVEGVEDKMNPVFQMNPGKDKVIFNDEHPYFDVAKKNRDFAAGNFGLDIPDED